MSYVAGVVKASTIGFVEVKVITSAEIYIRPALRVSEDWDIPKLRADRLSCQIMSRAHTSVR